MLNSCRIAQSCTPSSGIIALMRRSFVSTAPTSSSALSCSMHGVGCQPKLASQRPRGGSATPNGFRSWRATDQRSHQPSWRERGRRRRLRAWPARGGFQGLGFYCTGPGAGCRRDLSPQGLRDFGDGRPRGTQDYPTLAKIYAGLGVGGCRHGQTLDEVPAEEPDLRHNRCRIRREPASRPQRHASRRAGGRRAKYRRRSPWSVDQSHAGRFRRAERGARGGPERILRSGARVPATARADRRRRRPPC